MPPAGWWRSSRHSQREGWKKSSSDTKAKANVASASDHDHALATYLLNNQFASIARTATGDPNIRHEVYDTGATCHMSPYREDFIDLEPLDTPVTIATADGRALSAIARGTVWSPLRTVIPHLVYACAMHSSLLVSRLRSFRSVGSIRWAIQLSSRTAHVLFVIPTGIKLRRLPARILGCIRSSGGLNLRMLRR